LKVKLQLGRLQKILRIKIYSKYPSALKWMLISWLNALAAAWPDRV